MQISAKEKSHFSFSIAKIPVRFVPRNLHPCTDSIGIPYICFILNDLYMDSIELKWIETAVIILIYILLRVFLFRTIKRMVRKFQILEERRKIIERIINIGFIIIAVLSIAAVWGVDKNQLFVFMTSTVTVLGIAFFAQWSFLSNITAGVIVFFSHPIKIGDQIRLTDKDYLVEGRLESISFFFMHILAEDGNIITVPNSMALQKTIYIIHETNSKI